MFAPLFDDSDYVSQGSGRARVNLFAREGARVVVTEPDTASGEAVSGPTAELWQ